MTIHIAVEHNSPLQKITSKLLDTVALRVPRHRLKILDLHPALSMR